MTAEAVSELRSEKMSLSELPDIYCLGVKALGACRYDLSNPALTFFSIGQLATVVTMTLALSQIAKPIVKFRLTTRFSPVWMPWVGIAFAVVCVFAAAALRALPVREVPILGYPIFWEFLGGVALVASSAVMIVRVTFKTHLSKWNAKRYLKSSYSLIATGTADDLKEYGDEIVRSVAIAVAECKRHQTRPKIISSSAEEKETLTEFERACYTLLDLWSDEKLCHALITRCPRTAVALVSAVQKNRLYGAGPRALVNELINQAFSQTDSILHREGNYSGLGRYKSFMNATFGDIDFLRMLRPLQAWQIHGKEQVSPAQVERYGDAISIALRASIREDRIRDLYEVLSCTLDIVNRIALQAAWAMTRIPEGELSSSEWPMVLRECGRIIEEAIKTVGELPAELQPHEDEIAIDSATYNPLNDRTIFHALGEGAHEHLETIAQCIGHDISTRLDTISIWDAIFPREHNVSNANTAIRVRFIFALLAKINQNLDTENWFYPIVARLLLSMWGLPNCVGEVPPLDASYTREESDLYVHVMTMYRQNFLSIRQKDAEFANKLLPKQIVYLDNPPRLQQRWFRDKTTSLNLLP